MRKYHNDELGVNTQLWPHLANAAFEDVFYAELFGNHLHIDRLPLETPTSIS